MYQAGIVAVIRGTSDENSYKTAKACIAGNVVGIELAFTSPDAEVTIRRLVHEYKDDTHVVIGAGTVLDSQTARIAILAGAQFIVSPSFSEETAKECNLYGVPYIPGCYSPTEVQDALTFGSDLIKIFPSSLVGSKYISEIHGPFPYVNVMPSGGITLDNIEEWFKNGAFVIGVGGNLVSPGKEEKYELVKKNAQCFSESVYKIKNTNY
ncbi:bifunctional 2-keto-4-hydroxyglutarate aldolase/2-keto-3-deoxy-6-phosphogluconate aldolase [Lactobacillus corticis]|uniref:2-keto-3-deoxy-6-phosphogluconate aldolase n=1 Tax=Lactobacillus corticis TaxID=2201249 RepID=A0A916VII5_9LACO|nr:bifunctional 2-keto-4-hydroxyglutarate aldolase/2-keto-3-deoxy-6-phosphogluconate aldolase [Lactobacillus corticis]GFZ27435.1 2-keto-3-deoxy-6-phosphogluconate aldolase [Lactobacillus corticis]